MSLDLDTIKKDLRAAAIGVIGGLLLYAFITLVGGYIVSRFWPQNEFPGITAFFFFLYGLVGLIASFPVYMMLKDRWTEADSGE